MGIRITALLLVILLLTGCGAGSGRYEATYLDLFDTVTTVTGYAGSEEEFQAVAQGIHDRLLVYHQLFDIYHDYPGVTNLKTVNDHAGEPVQVDRAIIDLLLFARDMAQETHGTVNVAMGSVLRLWHEARSSQPPALPDPAALEAAAAHVDPAALLIDEAASTVCLADPAMSLDVGAVAKGYAVEQVCRDLPSGYLVSVGGNVRATGPKPDGSAWSVGLQDPDGGLLETVSLTSGSVVTSGDYQRFFTVDGVHYHHIIDPQTQMPGTKWRSVSVICPNSATADALSTALFLLDQETGEELAEQYQAKAVWVGDN